MDLKLGAYHVYVRNKVPEAEVEVASPNLQSPMPNFFSIEEDPQYITQSLSRLSLAEEELVILETQGISPTSLVYKTSRSANNTKSFLC
jgi:hypothetical protein